MRLLYKVSYLVSCSCVFSTVVYANNALAEESSSYDIFPRVGIALNQLSYVRPDGTKLDANYTAINFGFTVDFGQYYFDVGGDFFGADFLENQGEITGINRQDYTFTVGHAVGENMGVFLGYTVGEMKDDFQGEFHDDRGYFVGAAYNYHYDKTNYAFSMAYADLDGRIAVDELPASTTQGSTAGFSYGVTASGAFRETMAYTIALKIRQYEYEVNNSNDVTDKEIISLTLGLVF